MDSRKLDAQLIAHSHNVMTNITELNNTSNVRHLKTWGISGADTMSASFKAKRRTGPPTVLPGRRVPASGGETLRRSKGAATPSPAAAPHQAEQQQPPHSDEDIVEPTSNNAARKAKDRNDDPESRNINYQRRHRQSSVNLWGGNTLLNKNQTPAPPVTTPAGTTKSQLRLANNTTPAIINQRGLMPTVEGIWHLTKAEDLSSNKDVVCAGLRFSENGNILACGSFDGSIQLFERKTGAQFAVLQDDDTRASGAPVTSIRFRPLDAELLVATYADGVVKVWNCRLQKSLVTVSQDCKALSAAYNKKGDRLAIGCDSGEIYVYDAHQMRINCVLTPTVANGNASANTVTGHTGRVFSMIYTHHTHELISGGWDNLVHVWDDRQSGSVRHIFGPHICGDGLDFEAEHDMILTASWRRTEDQLQLWDYKSGELVQNVVMKDCSSSLYCAQFIGRDFILVGGSETNCARLVQREAPHNTMARIVDIPGGVYYLDNNRIFKSSMAVPRIAVCSGRFVYVMDTGEMDGGTKKKPLAQVRPAAAVPASAATSARDDLLLDDASLTA